MKNIKLAVIEFDYHAEVLRNTCKIIEKSSIHLSVFTTTKIWDQVNLYKDFLPENINLYLFEKKSQPIGAFFNKHLRILNSVDIILFNTLASNYRLFSKLHLTSLIIIRIHNSNAYFKNFITSYVPKFEPFFLWKDFSHFVRNSILKLDWYHRKRILEKADYYAFANERIKQYAIANLNVAKNKAIALPFAFSSIKNWSKVDVNEGQEIVISVIGRVDERSRDYLFLYRSYVEISRRIKQKNYTIKLILLGSSNSFYGRKIAKMFSALQSIKFESFNRFVNQEEFNKHIKDTDFLILPIKVNTRYTIYDEIYGFTKISGNINDVITYRKPALITAQYPIDEELKSITATFSNEEQLADKIVEWCDKKTYKDLPINEVFRNYQLKVIKENFSNELAGIIE